MNSTLELLAAAQHPSGSFPTTVYNTKTDTRWEAHTLTTTYVICLMLFRLRESGYRGEHIDGILERGLSFLHQSLWVDPVEGWMVAHFNAFYPPDWEETALILMMLYECGRLSREDVEPMRQLIKANETSECGVGVWIKDPYTCDNGLNNVFDPITSLAVSEMLARVFSEVSLPTEQHLVRSMQKGTSSLYYVPSFQTFLYWLMGRVDVAPTLDRKDSVFFHNARRSHLVYSSSEVWMLADFLLRELRP